MESSISLGSGVRLIYERFVEGPIPWYCNRGSHSGLVVGPDYLDGIRGPTKVEKVGLRERQWWDKQLRDDASLPISLVVRTFGEQVRFPLV